MRSAGPLTINFEHHTHRFEVEPDDGVTFGRGATVDVDSNRFLHRRVGRFVTADGVWWLENLSDQLPLRVRAGGFTSLVPAGDRLALTHARTEVEFEAGPCRYRLTACLDDPPPRSAPPAATGGEPTDRDPLHVELTEEQRLLALVLAEPRLRGAGRDLPTNESAALRLGWPLSKFNRKLDWLCERLRRAGLSGMKTGDGRRTIGRRALLVDHLLERGLICEQDLALLDGHPPGSGEVA